MQPIDTPLKFGITTFVITLFIVNAAFGNILLALSLAVVFGCCGYAIWVIYQKSVSPEKKGYLSKLGEELDDKEDDGI